MTGNPVKGRSRDPETASAPERLSATRTRAEIRGQRDTGRRLVALQGAQGATWRPFSSPGGI